VNVYDFGAWKETGSHLDDHILKRCRDLLEPIFKEIERAKKEDIVPSYKCKTEDDDRVLEISHKGLGTPPQKITHFIILGEFKVNEKQTKIFIFKKEPLGCSKIRVSKDNYQIDSIKEFFPLSGKKDVEKVVDPTWKACFRTMNGNWFAFSNKGLFWISALETIKKVIGTPEGDVEEVARVKALEYIYGKTFFQGKARDPLVSENFIQSVANLQFTISFLEFKKYKYRIAFLFESQNETGEKYKIWFDCDDVSKSTVHFTKDFKKAYDFEASSTSPRIYLFQDKTKNVNETQINLFLFRKEKDEEEYEPFKNFFMTFDGKVQKMKEVKDVKGEPILLKTKRKRNAITKFKGRFSTITMDDSSPIDRKEEDGVENELEEHTENERVFSDIKKDSKRENREIGGEDEEEGRDLALWGHGQMAKKKTRASRPSRPKMGTPQSSTLNAWF